MSNCWSNSVRRKRGERGGRGADLELIETQRKVQDVGELTSQSLFLLQMLSGSRARAGEDVQEIQQTGL